MGSKKLYSIFNTTEILGVIDEQKARLNRLRASTAAVAVVAAMHGPPRRPSLVSDHRFQPSLARPTAAGWVGNGVVSQGSIQ